MNYPEVVDVEFKNYLRDVITDEGGNEILQKQYRKIGQYKKNWYLQELYKENMVDIKKHLCSNLFIIYCDQLYIAIRPI